MTRLANLRPRVGMLSGLVAPIEAVPGATPRMRGRKLQDVRHHWFMVHPLCVDCEKRGIVRAATELDHIVPLFKGGADDDSNRQGLCDPCHDAKTKLDLAGKPPGMAPWGGGFT